MNDAAGGQAQDWQERRQQLQDAVERHMIRYIGDFPPFFIERAEGSYIYDDRGRRILDFTSGQMCATLGHNHPDVVAAISRSCERAIHLFSWVLAPEVVELCRELAALLPPQLQKVHVAEYRQRGERGGDPHGQAHDRRPRGGRPHGVVPRPDRRRRRRHLLGRAPRLRPGDPGQHGHPGAERATVARSAIAMAPAICPAWRSASSWSMPSAPASRRPRSPSRSSAPAA